MRLLGLLWLRLESLPLDATCVKFPRLPWLPQLPWHKLQPGVLSYGHRLKDAIGRQQLLCCTQAELRKACGEAPGLKVFLAQ